MDLFRNQLDSQASGVFEDAGEVKVTTQIFDATLPSQIQFDDGGSPAGSQNSKDGSTVNSDKERPNFDAKIEGQEADKKADLKRQRVQTEYHALTKSVMNFTFKKAGNSLIVRQTEHAIGSFIPYQMKVRTFPVKFYDEQSELQKGVPVYKLLWKKMVGYAKIDLYIKNGFVYLLEPRKDGLLVQSIWDLENLFKVFTDTQESKVRLVFRRCQKLQAKEITTDDLNLLAHIFEEAKNLEVIGES